jgi:glutathione S-transferase
MRRPTLYQIAYSPWSEKARWALDHHRIDYEKVEYLPMLGAPWLKWRLRGRLRGKLTVPLVLDGDRLVQDSFEIARWADARGGNTPLVPEALSDLVAEWNACAEGLMAAGRARVLSRVAGSPMAQYEAVPPWARKIPGVQGPLFRMGARFLTRKYSLADHNVLEQGGAIRDALERLRAALGDRAAEGGALLGRFTLADIAMACALQFVRPVDDAFLRLGAATRRAWTEPVYSEDFADLLGWRDAIYAGFRRRGEARGARARGV